MAKHFFDETFDVKFKMLKGEPGTPGADGQDGIDGVNGFGFGTESDVLWEGIVGDQNEQFVLKHGASNYDYIDVYYEFYEVGTNNPSIYANGGIKTFSADTFGDESAIMSTNFMKAEHNSQIQTTAISCEAIISSVNSSDTTFSISYTCSYGLSGYSGYASVSPGSGGKEYLRITKVIGRRIVPNDTELIHKYIENESYDAGDGEVIWNWANSNICHITGSPLSEVNVAYMIIDSNDEVPSWLTPGQTYFLDFVLDGNDTVTIVVKYLLSSGSSNQFSVNPQYDKELTLPDNLIGIQMWLRVHTYTGVSLDSTVTVMLRNPTIQIPNKSIDTNKLANGSITTDKIVDGAVTNDKIASNVLSVKMDKTNPSCTGYFTLNRKPNSSVGQGSAVFGMQNDASGDCAHVEGAYNTAGGYCSHVSGYNTVSNRRAQVVIGRYNKIDEIGEDAFSFGKYAYIIGNGNSDNDRSNAFAVDWDGNVEAQGTINGIPKPPSTDGTYLLQVTIQNGETTYSWVSI